MYKIAICGKANTGKNTLSKMLVKQLREHNNKYMSASYMAFADPIKEMVGIMFPELPRKFLYGSSKYRDEIVPGAFKEGKLLTIRQLLIDLGTAGREYQPDIWLNNFDKRLNEIYRSIVVVTDVRFRNEFEHLRNKEFYQIRLYRDTGQPEIQHISETGQQFIQDSEFNYVIKNNGSLNDLKTEISNCIIPRLIDIKV